MTDNDDGRAPPETWLAFCQRIAREHGAEGSTGAADARAEIERDGWSRETARAFLENASAPRDAYARGYDGAVRWYADVSCGLSPSPAGPR